MRKSLVVLASLATLALPLFAASPQKHGKWQITTQVEMPGVPVQAPPVTQTVCLTAADVENPQKSVPADANHDCKVSDYKIDGNTISWTVSCPKMQALGSGKITFAGDSYSGAMKLMVHEHEMSMKYSGKRLGDCDK
ncbi:MAG: DUF3617 family protein [Acidobacteria bacterium]|nr:DUF3617 family protein [Acidobacteriota bacterium]MBV9479089.1 DUF3617 family protein [Acidobacteriota bacterium]